MFKLSKNRGKDLRNLFIYDFVDKGARKGEPLSTYLKTGNKNQFFVLECVL